jgi:Mlc titration factor MtfA (ptsG expression regulator)
LVVTDRIRLTIAA